MNNARNTAPDLGKFHGRRIAVTGATGMLGSHLVAELLRAGYTDITLPVRDAAASPSRRPPSEGSAYTPPKAC